MNKTVANQPVQEIEISREQYEKLQQENRWLKYQLDELKRLVYGSKSERFIPSGTSMAQLNLFEQQDDQEAAKEPETEEISYTRKKDKKEQQSAIRVKIPAHFPRVEEIIEPEGKEGLKKIGEEVTELLEYSPAKIYVRKIVRPKYAKADSDGVIIAQLPSLPIPKGNAGASLLAQVMVSKFVDHLPFYRQVQIFKRSNLQLSDSTLSGWFNKTTDLLGPLYHALEKQVLQSDYLQGDESPIGVQDSHKKGALHKGYHWVYRSPVERLVLFKYHPGRGREVPETVLQTFNGTLQTDGYQAYDNMKTKGKITLMACMAHARRYFDKALDYDAQRAGHVLSLMQRLYEMERKARERNIDFATRKRYRQLFAKPILAELKQWLDDNLLKVLPKSPIGKSIAYTLGLWTKLCRYTEDGKYEIDNNLIENAIRPMALGRKNYLFAGSHQAAQKAAMMYSFFATCKTNDVEPLEWLTNVLDRLPDHKANRLVELLPQNWKPSSSPA